MDQLRHLLSDFPMGIYLILFLAPFIQEDAAVIGGASAAMGGLGHQALLFMALLAGLTLSDLWKYGVGRLAHTQRWAAHLSKNPAIHGFRGAVISRLGLTLVVARFIPGTRIPLYIASGYFRAPFGRFLAFLILSASIYIGLAFALFHWLGQIAGRKVTTYAPMVAGGLIVAMVLITLGRKLGRRWLTKRQL